MADKLSYTFEINAKTPGLDDATSKLDKVNKALVKADVGVDRFTKSLKLTGIEGKAMGRGFDAVAARLPGATGALVGMGRSGAAAVGGAATAVAGLSAGLLAAGGAAAAAAAAVVGVGLAAKKLADLAISHGSAEQRTQFAFRNRFGVDQAAELAGWIDRVAGKTEFTVGQFEDWTLQLANAGVAAGEIPKFLAAAGDVAARSNDKLGSMTGAIAALSRATATGKIEGRALLSLGLGVEQLRGLPAFAKLSDKEIRKKLGEGTIDIGDAFSVIAGPDKLLGDAAVGMGTTLQARLKNIGELPDLFLKTFANSPAIDKLSNLLGTIFDKLNPAGEQGQKIMGKLGTAFDRLGGAIAKVDIDAISGGISRFVQFGLTAVDFAYRFTEVFAGAANVAMRFGNAIYDGMADALSTVGDWANRIYMGALDVGANLWRGIVDGVAGGVSAVAGAVERLGNVAVEKVKDVFGIHSPSVVFRGIGEMTVAGFTAGVEGRQREIDDVVRGAFAVPAPQGGRVSAMPGPIQVSTVVNVTVGVGAGMDPREQGEAVAAVAAPAITGELLAVFERIRMAHGT